MTVVQTQPALHDVIVAAKARLMKLHQAVLKGQLIEAAASERDVLELACLLGALAGSEGLCCAIAKDPRAPPVVLALLAQYASDEVRIAVASNPSTPAEDLMALAESELTMRAVAGNPSAPTEVLVPLASHWDVGVRMKVVHNPSTPDSVRRKLLGPEVATESYLP